MFSKPGKINSPSRRSVRKTLQRGAVPEASRSDGSLKAWCTVNRATLRDNSNTITLSWELVSVPEPLLTPLTHGNCGKRQNKSPLWKPGSHRQRNMSQWCSLSRLTSCISSGFSPPQSSCSTSHGTRVHCHGSAGPVWRHHPVRSAPWWPTCACVCARRNRIY